jgi:cytochrome P450
VFNPFEPGFFDDPYAQYATLRTADPVHRSPIDVWMLFEYEQCFSLLRNPSLSVEVRKAIEAGGEAMAERRAQRLETFTELVPEVEGPTDNRSILNIDPPDHTRIRRLVSKVFTPKRVEELRPMIRAQVAGHLDAMAERGDADIIADLAFPLPFTVISEMMGMPDGDRDQLRAWSHAAVKLLDPIMDPEEIRLAVLAAGEMYTYCDGVIAWKREHLADDLLSALITATDDGDQLTPSELLDQVVVLFMAGHETTVNLIGNGTLALLEHPEQCELLRNDPSLDANAVDELLRFDSPVQFSRRITLTDIEIEGHAITAGSFVMTCLGSANHDPAVFGPDADQLDLRRPSASRHLSFGSGVHHCLGASLARMEGQEAIGALVRRFGDLALAGDPVRNNRIVLRGLDHLPVSFTPR